MRTLRRLRIADAPTLTQVAVRSYRDTYQGTLSKNEIDKRIFENHRLEDFEALLIDDNRILWGLFEGNDCHSFLELSTKKVISSVPLEGLLQLSRLYTIQKGRGHGSTLMKKASEEAIQRGHTGLWLHCFEDNKEAIDFYLRKDFKIAGIDAFAILSDTTRFDLVLTKSPA